MAIEKTYQVVGSDTMLTRHMKFMVKVPQGDGHILVPRSITLKGHIRPRRTKGKLVTSEKALIEAIDQRIQNAGAKTGIICVSERVIKDSLAQKTPEVVETKSGNKAFSTDVVPGDIKVSQEPDVQEPDVQEPDGLNNPPPDAAPAPPIEKTEVCGISKAQDAKAYLLKNIEGLTTRDVTNIEKITKIAAENNIVFVDWKL